MANAYHVRAGDCVDYLTASAKWQSVKVTSVTDQNNLVLAITQPSGSRTALNGGVAVPRRTSPTQTNVWRQH